MDRIWFINSKTFTQHEFWNQIVMINSLGFIVEVIWKDYFTYETML